MLGLRLCATTPSLALLFLKSHLILEFAELEVRATVWNPLSGRLKRTHCASRNIKYHVLSETNPYTASLTHQIVVPFLKEKLSPINKSMWHFPKQFIQNPNYNSTHLVYIQFNRHLSDYFTPSTRNSINKFRVKERG